MTEFILISLYVNCKGYQLLEPDEFKWGKYISYRDDSFCEEDRESRVVPEKLRPTNIDKAIAYRCTSEILIPNITLYRSFSPQQERNVLMEIYNLTAGHKWNNNTHWGNDSVPHCSWHGIKCDITNSHVISITLINNNLNGTLPKSLWKLRNLQILCIGTNAELSGNLNEILSANMTNLRTLHLPFNKLSGKIPDEILPSMKSLEIVQLCCQLRDGFFGEIPKDIGNLTQLQVLGLGGSRLTGSIPKSISKLKKLWFLDLKSAKSLSGGFANLFNLSSLRYMHLSRAGLNGTLPDDFGLYYPAMVECLLPGNRFTGNIPPTLGNMTHLRYLNFARNNFSGKIPRNIGSVSSRDIVDLSGNQLTSFEEGIKFNDLEVLILAGNKNLTHSFNSLLVALESSRKSLRILNIGECNFYGIIPTELWIFENLISVDLKKNSLKGELPWAFHILYFLHDLDVSANNLSGQIPGNYADLPSLKLLDVSKNPSMHNNEEEHGILPKYMKVDFVTLTYRNPIDKFKCPNIGLNDNTLVILDPSYYFYRLCICDRGYYGSGKTCLPCMEGGTCKDEKPPSQNMTIKRGHWPSSRDQNVTHLVSCSQALGTSPHVRTPCNPSGNCRCWIDTDRSPSTICNKSCLCLTGSKDRFCSLCEHGFYKQGIICHACPQSNTSVFILAALAVLTIILMTLGFCLYEEKRFFSTVLVFTQIIILALLAVFHIIPAWLLELNAIALFIGLAERGRAARGIMKISVYYFQTLDALISCTNIWPPRVLKIQRYISNVFNFHFSGLACEFPNLFTPLGELGSLILLPVICILCIWSYFGLVCLMGGILNVHNLQERRLRLRNTCLQLSIVSLNVTYFPIVKKTASVLAPCAKDNNYHYLREAPWMECEGPVYTMLQVLGWLSLGLYAMGVPFGVFLPLLRNNKVAIRYELPQQDQESLDSWLGSIYLPYKKEFRSCFEIIFLLRRMLIAFALSLITRSSSFQTIAVCFVLLVSLCFQLLFKPYIDSYQKFPLENTAEALVLLTLHFSFMNVRYAARNPASSTPIVWMIVVVNVVLVFGMVMSMIVLLGRSHAAENATMRVHLRATDEDDLTLPLLDDGAYND
ncbi:putative leucine-rich repeat-containing protein DDB_G0281931 [Stylophora pistillata]|uniref:putative leucine-rich repeat-containing protein DDB_G0281931 n=1 Tax=Stylophora pistillata TaxID=50429 RepID=UPI000C050F28|nr:putative leucine-rich repeat-containing protein DDB_G0281931 [Stylophora pistillata]